MKFNYNTPAELFISKPRIGSRSRMKYRRFGTAAEAIRFAVEDFPAVRTLGAWMQVGDDRFNSDQIRGLYDRSDYPLHRMLGRTKRAAHS
jgi:hypothetical protein